MLKLLGWYSAFTLKFDKDFFLRLRSSSSLKTCVFSVNIYEHDLTPSTLFSLIKTSQTVHLILKSKPFKTKKHAAIMMLSL